MIAAPLYTGGPHVEEAIASLLRQSYREFALILVDDGLDPASRDAVRALAESDGRLVYVRNEERLGMYANWRRCFDLAVARHPAAKYFAWASDHDVWEPDWLAELVAALDRDDDVVLAYPQSVRIDAEGNETRAPFSFSTVGIVAAKSRVDALCTDSFAGSMVYGLFRTDALRRAGVFRPIMSPDRLLMLELAVQGQFAQVERVLWRRRFQGLANRHRQRRGLFRGRPPWHSYLPPALVHVAVLTGVYGLRGSEGVSRSQGLRLSVALARGAMSLYLRRRRARVFKRMRRRARVFRVAARRLAGRG